VSDIHRRSFTFYLMDLDGRPLNQAQRAELQAHLSTCPTCRADRQLYQGLRARAARRYPVPPGPLALDKVLRRARQRTWLRWAALPVRAAFWLALALLVFVLVQFLFTFLRPVPAVRPPAGPTPLASTPSASPTPFAQAAGKIPVEPLVQGDPSGRGSWSPKGDYFFVPVLEAPAPGGDWRTTGLHFISAATGQDCRASETFLGPQGLQSYAWLDDRQLLFVDSKGRTLLFTPCQSGYQDLSDRFTGSLVRVATPLSAPWLATPGPLLLEGPSAYWLLDPATLQARSLADPLPSPNQGDGFAWIPAGHRISVIQPLPDRPGLSRLVLLDLDSGKVLRSLEIDASDEGRAPLVEWLGPERPFVWSFGSGGPLMLDLSVDPPKGVRVFPELFSVALTYPDQISTMGVFYAPASGSYHVVADLNMPDDKSIYLYHGESGQVEKIAGERNVIMALPGDQWYSIVPWQDTPSFDDAYDLVWVDAPDRGPAHFQVSGHTPRNYSILQSALLPGSAKMVFGSTQGISLVGLPGGETLSFWRLSGAEDSLLSLLSLAPDGRSLIATARLNPAPDGKNQGSLLYWLALEK
jgi:hypothetical protein